MCPAIHISSRSWLRSSSTHEPSDPPLRVVSSLFFLFLVILMKQRRKGTTCRAGLGGKGSGVSARPVGRGKTGGRRRGGGKKGFGWRSKKNGKESELSPRVPPRHHRRPFFCSPAVRCTVYCLCYFFRSPLPFKPAPAPAPCPGRNRRRDLGGESGAEPALGTPRLGRREARHPSPRGGGWTLPVNDPSAGSPTETLLRLLLPLDSQV